MHILVRCVLIVVGLALTAAGIGLLRFDRRAGRRYSFPVEPIPAATGRDSLARGEHLARTVAGCAECHGEDFGGRVFPEDALLRLSAPNITPGEGGVVAHYDGDDWVRAIVHGVGRDGRPLLIMPATELRALSDDDVAAILGYMVQLPPVDRRVPRPQVKLPGRIVAGLVGLPLFPAEAVGHQTARAARPPVGPTRAYGNYLAQFCSGCHGKDFRGGEKHGPDAPPAADISPAAMAGWTYEEFVRALREGKRRDGSELSPAMPWRATRSLTDEELRALYLALVGGNVN